MNQSPEEMTKAFGQIVAKCWSDDTYRERFRKDPAQVFRENNVPVPDGATIKVVENTPNEVFLVLPKQPTEELSDEMLEKVAGGSTAGSASSAGTASCMTCPSTLACLGSAGSAGSG
jgi:hypothetical protein